MAPLSIDSIIRASQKLGATDVHISVGRPPKLRLANGFRDLDTGPLDWDTCRALAFERAPTDAKERLKHEGSFGYSIHHIEPDGTPAYFVRAHATEEILGMYIALRLLPTKIPHFSELGLSPNIPALFSRQEGFILFVGETGSGKSTSLASCVVEATDKYKRGLHSLESPVEFVYPRSDSSTAPPIIQRDIPINCPSFAFALCDALRSDPNVILCGEIRDHEELDAAFKLAESGHLLASTMHVKTAAEVIDRVTDIVPPEKVTSTLSMLSRTMLGIVAQRLVPREDKSGKVLAYELLLFDSHMRKLVRERDISAITARIEEEKEGLQSFDGHLYRLFEQRVISRETALDYARNRDRLLTMFRGIKSR